MDITKCATIGSAVREVIGARRLGVIVGEWTSEYSQMPVYAVLFDGEPRSELAIPETLEMAWGHVSPEDERRAFSADVETDWSILFS